MTTSETTFIFTSFRTINCGEEVLWQNVKNSTKLLPKDLYITCQNCVQTTGKCLIDKKEVNQSKR